MKQASVDMDGYQSSDEAFRHGMRGPGETADAAHTRASLFIAGEIRNAIDLQANWILNGKRGFSPDAVYIMGNALHTITDMRSPHHAGFQLWDLLSPEGVIKGATHGLVEYLRGPTYELALGLATYDAMVEWSTFVWASEKRAAEKHARDK